MAKAQHFLHQKGKGGEKYSASRRKSKSRPRLDKNITQRNEVQSHWVFPALQGPVLCTQTAQWHSNAANAPCAQSEMQSGLCPQPLSQVFKRGDHFPKISGDVYKCLKSRSHITKLLDPLSQKACTENSGRRDRWDIKDNKKPNY